MASESMSEADMPQIEDPGEYNQRRRLKAIGDARQTAREAILYLQSGADLGQYEDPTSFAYAAVQGFAMEIEWLVRQYGGERYFTEELGPVQIGPPDTTEFYNRDTQGGRFLGMSKLQSKKISIQGLYDSKGTGAGFVNYQPRLSRTWKTVVDDPKKGPENKTATVTAKMPAQVIINANSLCNRFISETDLDAKIEKQKPHGEV